MSAKANLVCLLFIIALICVLCSKSKGVGFTTPLLESD